MRILSFSEYIDEGKKNPQRTVFSIGVFDGVHFGHKAILEDLRRLKKESGAECSAVFTFSTNPKGRKGDLDTLRLRAENIAEYDVDVLAVIDFSTDFSMITAVGFVDMLSSSMIAVGAAVGDDFRFGNPHEEGSGRDLGLLLRRKGFDCTIDIVDSVLTEDGEKISSTYMRQMINKGELGCIPGLSGQFYRVDLVPLPYRSCSGELIFSRASIHQLLPPPGSYDAALCHADGKEEACIALIGEIDLRIRMDAAATASSAGTCGKEAMLLDSLYLEKRR